MFANSGPGAHFMSRCEAPDGAWQRRDLVPDDVGPFLSPEGARNAEAVTGRNREKIQHAEGQVAKRDLNSNVRQEHGRKDEKQVHHRAAKGNEGIIAATNAARPDDVCAIDADTELAHRNLEGGGAEDVTDFV